MKTQKTKVNRGFCVQTRNGHAFDPKIKKIDVIELDDIAHALSNICRYSGHCSEFYSVAEHSVLVSRIVRKLWPDDIQAIWAGLLHDATEAYVGDMTTPLKILMPQFMDIENKIAEDVAEKFKIQWTKQTTERVKVADLTALSTEARLLFENVSHWDMIRNYEPLDDLLNLNFPLTPKNARKLFEREFVKIQKEMQSAKK